jgi:hypothetical protein
MKDGKRVPTDGSSWSRLEPRKRSASRATTKAPAGLAARFRPSHRLRAGLFVALVGACIVAGCASDPVTTIQTGAGDTSSPSAVGASPASANIAATPSAATSAPPSVDVGDQAAATGGASFVPTATGVLPPTGSESSTGWLAGEPNPRLTPGALNPAVTQATIDSTICVSGWTATVRPPESFTYALKVQQIAQYGYSDTRTSSYEEDHLISLELGGSPADPRNLWPEPYTASLSDGRSSGAYTKDAYETELKTEVCAGTITLARAQADIGDHWVHAYYGIALSGSPANPPSTPAPTSAVTSPPVGSLSVSITNLPASVSHGANATLVAVTSPGATCSASVTYASGTVSTAAGLRTQPIAGSSGSVSWTWKVGTSTKPGTSTARVTCSLGGASASASQTFQVT